MSARNFSRAVWFGTIIGAMCAVSMVTLAYIAQFITPAFVAQMIPVSQPLNLLTFEGNGFIIVIAFFFARTVVRAAVR
jgi:hypothetical protein